MVLPAPAAACNSRILVTFTRPVPQPPDAALVHELASTAGAELTYVSAISGNLYVFDVSVAGKSNCGKAIERLRHDPRIRSADLDARRHPH
ncbi:MAG: hypothetical protein ACREVV_14340 [Steroidobacteraceae bacterium]